MTSQLHRYCEKQGVKIDCTYGARLDWAKQSDWQHRSNGYTVRLRYQRRQLTTDFWMGPAHESEPTAADVISCLISDSQACYQTFSEWCSDLGFDSDSIQASGTYEACRRSGRKIRRLLGDDFDKFAAMEH